MVLLIWFCHSRLTIYVPHKVCIWLWAQYTCACVVLAARFRIDPSTSPTHSHSPDIYAHQTIYIFCFTSIRWGSLMLCVCLCLCVSVVMTHTHEMAHGTHSKIHCTLITKKNTLSHIPMDWHSHSATKHKWWPPLGDNGKNCANLFITWNTQTQVQRYTMQELSSFPVCWHMKRAHRTRSYNIYKVWHKLQQYNI